MRFNKIIIIILTIIPLFLTISNNRSWSLEYTGDRFRDPLRMLIPRHIAEDEFIRPRLALQGVLWGGRRPTAIVNNTVVSVGDVVSGVKILDIRRGAVILLYRGERFILE